MVQSSIFYKIIENILHNFISHKTITRTSWTNIQKNVLKPVIVFIGV